MTPPRESHFTQLVEHGKLPYASGGCIAARALAEAVVGHVPKLDDDAVRGFYEFCQYVTAYPGSARDWLSGNGGEE